jgi:4'-phosphopantetheinyl transferase
MLLLPMHEVHLYCASLDTLATRLTHFAATLNVDERARAARFHFARDRQRYIVARGLLRMILGHYLAVEAVQLHFCYNDFGKPSLAAPYSDGGLTFNLAHSGSYALYGLARQRQVGVDIEQVRLDLELEQLVGQVFSRAEQQSWRRLVLAGADADSWPCGGGGGGR